MFIRSFHIFIPAAFFCLVFAPPLHPDVILDNDHGSPAYIESGAWNTSGSTGYNGGTYRYSIRKGSFAKWIPNLPHPLSCDVIAVFRTGTNRGDDASYTITHANGITQVTISHYSSSTPIVEKNLGHFDFNSGAAGSVQLDAATSGKVYVSDAIIFRTGRDDPPMISPTNLLPVKPIPPCPVPLNTVITDDDGISTAMVVYTVTPPGTTHTIPLHDDGMHGDRNAGDGNYGAIIPRQDEGTTVTFQYMARDTIAQETRTRTFSFNTISTGTLPEFRAIWAASWWSGFLNPDEADELVTTCRESNLNNLIPEVRKIGDAYYDSALEPRANNITGGDSWDPLEYVCGIAHDATGGKKRMEVHPWFCMQRIWMNSSGELPPGHVLLRHPEFEMTMRDGTTGETSRWLDPGHPGAVDHNIAVVLDCLSKYDLDGIHMDYIRYPGSEWGYNPVSVQRFNEIYGRSGVPDPGDPDWSDWRRECVTLEVKKLYVKMGKMKPNVLLTAATQSYGDYSNFEESGPYKSTLQDWVRWLHDGIFDYNIMMNYKASDQVEDFRGWVERSLAEDDRRGSIIGISTNSHDSIQDTIDQLLYCRYRGADGMNIFSWRGEVSGNTAGETRGQFYATLKSQLYPTWVDPPPSPWKSDPTTGIFEGTVTFRGNPVDHAAVWIEGRAETRTVTDGSGWYGILDSPVGGHTLHFSKSGMRDGLVSSSIPGAGEIVTVDVELEPAISGSSWVVE